MSERNPSRALPVSVVIPARNEEREIGRCLDSLARQTFRDFEVIVVDNGSMDRTASLARSRRVRVIEEPRRGFSPARQAGFEAASGSIVASTDADTVVPPDWLARIEEAFEEQPQTVGVFGPFRYQPHSAPSALADQLAPYCSTCLVACQWLSWKFGRPQFPGSNFAVHRDSFFEVSGFRSPATQRFYSCFEDIQLGLKLDCIGEVRYLPDLVVWASARNLRSVRANLFRPVRRAAALHLMGREL